MSYLLEEQMRQRVEELRREADLCRRRPQPAMRSRAARWLRSIADRIEAGHRPAVRVGSGNSLLQERNYR